MSSPKRRIGNTDSFYLNILAVRQINDTGTLLIHIRTIRIPLPTQPKRFPITETIAIFCLTNSSGKKATQQDRTIRGKIGAENEAKFL